jgi:hypothetical protein
MWALMHILGNAPDLDVAFPDRVNATRHATSWTCSTSCLLSAKLPEDQAFRQARIARISTASALPAKSTVRPLPHP